MPNSRWTDGETVAWLLCQSALHHCDETTRENQAKGGRNSSAQFQTMVHSPLYLGPMARLDVMAGGGWRRVWSLHDNPRQSSRVCTPTIRTLQRWPTYWVLILSQQPIKWAPSVDKSTEKVRELVINKCQSPPCTLLNWAPNLYLPCCVWTIF